MKLIVKNLLMVGFLSQVHCASFNQGMKDSAQLKYSDRVCNSAFDRVHLNTVTTSSERPQYQKCLQKSRRQHEHTQSMALGQIILGLWGAIFGMNDIKKVTGH